MERIYMDHAAATGLSPEAREAMEPYWAEHFANPGAIHQEGVIAKRAIEASRKQIAEIIGAHTDEILFCASATESANIALQGAVSAWQRTHPGRTPHLIVSEIEHAAVLECASLLEVRGARVTRIPVDADGLVHLSALVGAITEDTVLIAVMLANNEIGTIQPIPEIAKAIRKWKKDVRKVSRDVRTKGDDRYPLLYTDAAQATPYLRLHISSLGMDLLTVSSGKIRGPKGVALLFRSRGIPLDPIIVGGGQESGLRAGTESVPLIVGFAEALRLSQGSCDSESDRLRPMQVALVSGLTESFPDVIVNGSLTSRLPNNVHFSFPDIDHEFLTLALDAKGFAVSTKSACHEQETDTSHVLLALRRADGTHRPLNGIRVSLGHTSAPEHIPALLEALQEIRATLIPVSRAAIQDGSH